MSKISSFKSIEIKHDIYRSKDCIKKFDESVREHAMKIINFKKKKKEVINKREAGIKKKKTQKFVIFVKTKLKKNM